MCGNNSGFTRPFASDDCKLVKACIAFTLELLSDGYSCITPTIGKIFFSGRTARDHDRICDTTFGDHACLDFFSFRVGASSRVVLVDLDLVGIKGRYRTIHFCKWINTCRRVARDGSGCSQRLARRFQLLRLLIRFCGGIAHAV
ncbi:MAG: hypothetical protein DI604_23360 [Delftia acidovorans]|nr:MAG: hypothetical protein DI604_23360 [Delftia acidovorans]